MGKNKIAKDELVFKPYPPVPFRNKVAMLGMVSTTMGSAVMFHSKLAFPFLCGILMWIAGALWVADAMEMD